MGLGLLLFLYDIGGCNSSPHLYVENLSTHSELSAFLFPSVCFCMTLVTLVTLVFAIHLSHVENLSTQSELSAFFFPSLRLGRLGRYYRRRCADVSLCLFSYKLRNSETQHFLLPGLGRFMLDTYVCIFHLYQIRNYVWQTLLGC